MSHRDKELNPLLAPGAAGFAIAAVSAVILAVAWGFQLAGYKPCPLCLEERIPYYAAIPAGLVAALFARAAPKLATLILAALCLGFLYNAGLSFYHAGVEWHFWEGPATCSGDSLQVTHSLSERLKHNSGVRCDEAALRILGVSLAGYNALISAFLAVFCLLSLRRSIKPAA